MRKPTAASLKKVTPENLARLGPERLAELLIDFAEGRAELKRRLRMELAAEQGAEHLATEVDKRLASLETSRARVSWRSRATFLRDLEALRKLIAGRLAELEPATALDRTWRFLGLADAVARRIRNKDDAVEVIFDRAAEGLGGLIAAGSDLETPGRLVEAVIRSPSRWADWMPTVVQAAPPHVLAAALAALRERPANPGLMLVIRQLADAVGDIDAFQSTFAPAALKTPAIAAEIAARLLAAGRVDEAGFVLGEAKGQAKAGGWLAGKPRPNDIDVAWESAWIDYLEQSGQGAAAQEARWASFERSLSAERARAFVRRLGDFDDVEAEHRAFAHAAGHADASGALRFLMDWPALPEAARLVQARADELNVTQEEVELWAGKLRIRQPAAAHTLLRKAAAAAFRRRDFATSDRLTAEADTIDLG